jgi:hypothetical protein
MIVSISKWSQIEQMRWQLTIFRDYAKERQIVHTKLIIQFVSLKIIINSFELIGTQYTGS